jgi:hypothetical protein
VDGMVATCQVGTTAALIIFYPEAKGVQCKSGRGLDLRSGDFEQRMGAEFRGLAVFAVRGELGKVWRHSFHCATARNPPPNSVPLLVISQPSTTRALCLIPHAVLLIPPRNFNDQARCAPAYHLARRAGMAAPGYHMDDLTKPLGEKWT